MSHHPEEMPDGTEQIEVTGGSVIAAEFLLDHGDTDIDGALGKIADNDGEHSEVSFRTKQPSPAETIEAYRKDHTDRIE